MQKKTINNIVKDTYRKSLSIQFSLDGFSFCTSNPDTKEIYHFTIYDFEETIVSPEKLLIKIQDLFKENDYFLNQHFEKITVIHQNNLSTLVPSLFFKEEEIKTYLDYNIKTLTNDFIAFDSLEQLDIKNIYIPYTNINNYLFECFGEFEYKHHSTILIEKLITLSDNNKNKRVYVNVTNKNFDVIVIKDSKLIFYNNFSFNSAEDFIYYILFTAEQLKMNPDKLLLIFIGDIEKNSEIYHITYQYIRNINFLDIKNSTFENDKNISLHSNFIITP